MSVRPDRSFRALTRFFVVFLGLCTVFFLLGAASMLATAKVGPGLGFLAAAAAAVGLGLLATLSMRRAGPPLTLSVDADHIEFRHPDGAVETVPRDHVGLVCLKSFLRLGVTQIAVYGPDRSLVGRWPTNWNKGPSRTVRALSSAGYPWVVHDQSIFVPHFTRLRSKQAPSWTDEVILR